VIDGCVAEIGPAHAPPLSPALSRIPSKRALFAADSYFLDSWEDARRVVGDRLPGFLESRTAVLLKPDAVAARKLHPAIDALREYGFAVVAATTCRIDRHKARAFWHYQWNAATRDRRDLADLMLSATDSLFLVLRLPAGQLPASVALSELKGSADPVSERAGKLRHALGSEAFLLNFVHTADEPADVVRELGIVAGPEEREALYRSAAAGDELAERARALADSLYEQAPAQELRLAATLDRVRATVDGLAGETAELRDMLAQVELGRFRDWRAVDERVRRAGGRIERWDLITLGAFLMSPTDTSRAPVIPGVSAADWAAPSQSDSTENRSAMQASSMSAPMFATRNTSPRSSA
jgi:nucleoside diphosphate kinase